MRPNSSHMAEKDDFIREVFHGFEVASWRANAKLETAGRATDFSVSEDDDNEVEGILKLLLPLLTQFHKTYS